MCKYILYTRNTVAELVKSINIKFLLSWQLVWSVCVLQATVYKYIKCV